MSIAGALRSAIQFGDYVFPSSFMLKERDQESSLDDQKIPLRDGSVIPIASRMAKTISIKGSVGGWGQVDSNGDFILNRDNATAELNRMELALSQGKQALIVGDSDARVIVCQRKSSKATYFEAGLGMYAELAIDFVAEDPRWHSATLRNAGGFNSGTEVVTADGNAIMYPIITVQATASAIAPSIGIAPSGFGGVVKILPVLTMASGDVLTIDSNPRNRPNAILLNGQPRLDLLSSTSSLQNSIGNAEFFPYLLGGDNDVEVFNEAGSGFTWSIVWNDAFLY